PRAEKSEGGGALKSLLGLFVKVVPDEEETTAPPAAPAPPRQAQPLPPQHAPPQPRAPQRVADLVAGEPTPKFHAPPATAQAGADAASAPLDQLYREAGIGASACTLDELATLLENPTIANQPLSVKIVAVSLALSAKGVNIEVPIADAVRRDRALDAYQAMLDERARQIEQTSNTRIQQISQEVEEYLKRKQSEMDGLRAQVTDARKQAVEFSVRREVEEKRMADLISPFLEGKPNPVSVGNQPGENKPQ
ncbi:MAG: hypothetical protein ACKV2V_02285, partial [Blastocatellia bacterium]